MTEHSAEFAARTGSGPPTPPGKDRMRLQVLHVAGCPGAVTLTARLAQLVSDRTEVEQRVVDDLDQATMLRMTGSPTLLIDGVDPFAVAGLPPSLSCRLYRDETGSVSPAPSPAQLREALALALAARSLPGPGRPAVADHRAEQAGSGLVWAGRSGIRLG
jgi:hypothetical protein